MKEYLESKVLQQLVLRFFEHLKPVAAICHGVLPVSRSQDAFSEKSVLHDYRTTALLTKQEHLAFQLTQHWCGDYYLTYPGMTVQNEVTTSLNDPNHFIAGPIPFRRDTLKHPEWGFTVVDRNDASARWPGDAHALAHAFIRLLEKARDN